MNSEMNKQIIIDLMSNPDFMSRLVEQEDIQSVKDLFKSEANIELSEQDVVTLGNAIDKYYKQIKNLSDDEMEKAVGAGVKANALGGAIGALVGLSASIAEEIYVKAGNTIGSKVGIKVFGAKSKNNMGGLVGFGSAVALGTAGGVAAGVRVAEGICKFINKNKK